MTFIYDPAIDGPWRVEAAEALIARLQEKVADAKRKVEIVPGGLYLDQHGTAYLAVDTAPHESKGVWLWRLHADGAAYAAPSDWHELHDFEFTPLQTCSGHILGADGTQVES